MDSFIKSTPSIKKIIEHLEKLEPFAHVDVRADEHGRPDTFLVITQTKFIVSGGEIKHLK